MGLWGWARKRIGSAEKREGDKREVRKEGNECVATLVCWALAGYDAAGYIAAGYIAF